MNENTIDTILRRAPRVRAPDGLLEKLNEAIQLPAREMPHRCARGNELTCWSRRWLPALGFALWFLGCVIVFGIQASRLAELREQRRALEAANAAGHRQALAAETALTLAEGELARLKKDLADVGRLQTELQQLRAEIQEAGDLRAQNLQLRDELKSQTAPPPKPAEDFFAVATARAERTRCVNSLKRLGLAARIWANDSKSDVMPDRVTLKAALSKIKTNEDETQNYQEDILFCPSDGVTSYEFLGPGAPESVPELIFSRCPIHNSYGLSDGSVQQVDPNKIQMVKKDGWWILQPR
jgi:hypothetical protein